ncbi:MAG: hypothetical protein RLZZ126_1604, partial [Pseudomonadota bacterium]
MNSSNTCPEHGLWCRLARRIGAVVTVMLSVIWMPPAALAQTVSMADTPLLALKTAPGLVMMTMSRDHRLFYAAYNDTSDIDGDGTIDIGFKPSITYYGNFVSSRCYDVVSITTYGNVLRPVANAVADDNVDGSNTGCRIAGVQYWHGNWMNWATTSRMDALRRVLYGGYRVVDSTTTLSGSTASTILTGASIPKDSHVWGKEFRPGRDTYDIRKYTKLAVPTAGNQHLFTVLSPNANPTYLFPPKFPPASGASASTAASITTVAPVLRYITNANLTTERIWYWASADVAQGIASNPANFVKGGGRTSVAATDLALKVEACVPISGVREAGCVGYPTLTPSVYKPTGVLHDYGATDSLKFGLITGTYQLNYSGGVVRRNIRSFKDELSTANGTFTDKDGIARTIDRITIHGWNGSIYDCGYKTSGDRNQGDCKSWGAPIAEMMYEGLRYFSGKGAGMTAFTNSGVLTADTTIGFGSPPAWQNPFQSKTQTSTGPTYGNPICSRPVQMVIADPITSFDSDQLPGSYFSTPTTGFGTALGANDLTGLNVNTEAGTIWTAESLGSRSVFIGQSGTNKDGNPTSKPASSFAQLRGHAPDETRSEGSYFAASVARFARTTGVPIGNPGGTPAVSTVAGSKIDTLAVALGSLTPKIEIPNPSGGVVTIVPISKAVGNAGINKAPGAYQATGAITGFYFDTYTATNIRAIVNFSDGDQGTDNETDAQAVYNITISGSSITVQMTQLDPFPGGIESHMGYVISGTTKDGMYLEMRNNTAGSGTVSAAGNVYYLDTLAGQDPAPGPGTTGYPRLNGNATGVGGLTANTCVAYDSTTASVAKPWGFTPGTSGTPSNNQKIAQLDTCIPSWGGRTAANSATSRTFAMATTPSTTGYIPRDPLWYAAKYGGPGVLDSNGDPTNYFKVTNPANLPAQMAKAFRSAAALAAVASTSVVGVGQRSLGTAAIYQANYDSLTWSSRLYAFKVESSGAVSNTTIWDASALLGAPSARTKLFLGRGGTSTPHQLTSGGYSSLSSSGSPSEQTDFGNSTIYEYLLGEKSGEERKGGTLRNRGTTSGTEFGSVLGDIVNSDPQIISKKDYGYTDSDATYAAFLVSLTTESLAVGANEGFFHIFNAAPTVTGGGELFSFIPQAARTNIKDLASTAYSHRYFVDGSIGQGHAKIKVPGDATTSWRTIVVGAGGAGAKTVFAVNAPNDQVYSANSVLWEINANTTLPTANSLGNVVGRPAIGKLTNGTWVAVFGNGYNSAAGTASLLVVNLETGAIIRQLNTNNAITANGLGSTEIVRKTSGNKDTIDYVYAADYKGNIWRFDLSASSTASWASNGTLIYSTP